MGWVETSEKKEKKKKGWSLAVVYAEPVSKVNV
jgi:hypothetical protein